MPPRRQRGEGSVYQRTDGRWTATLDLGWHDGKRKRKVRYAKTQAAAVRKLAEMKKELAATGGVASTAHTVESWMTHWLDDIAPERVRPSTLQGYRSKVANYILPKLGRLKLEKLEPQHVRAMYRDMEARGLSPRTRLQTHAILRRALTVAHREGKVARNVAALIDPPSIAGVERTTALTLEEITAVIEAARETPMFSRWLAALMLGLRQGEALGLTWADVDLDKGTLKVERALQRVKGRGLVMVEPKSRKSKRTLPVPRMLAEALLGHRERSWSCSTTAIASSTATTKQPVDSPENLSGTSTTPATAPALVWANPDGSPLDPRADWQAWTDLLEAAGVRHVRLHDARHCVGTLLAAMHIPDVIVSAILGHANVQVTHIYQDANLPMMRQALDMIDAAYRPGELEA